MTPATLDLELRTANSGTGSWHLAHPGQGTLCGLVRSRTHTAQPAPIPATRLSQVCRTCGRLYTTTLEG